MSHPLPTSPISVAPDAAAAWARIEETVRESSVMRCEGRVDEAAALVQTRLPALIREWSENSGRPADECRERLRELFAKAQAQVAEAMHARRLMLAAMPVQVREVMSDGRLQLRRRIPIDDVAGMLDALREADRPATKAERKTFPLSTRRPLAAAVAA